MNEYVYLYSQLNKSLQRRLLTNFKLLQAWYSRYLRA